MLFIAIVATALVLGYGLLFLVFAIAGGEGADSGDSVGTGRGVSVDLHGRDSAEDWVIVLDLDPGLTEGLVSASMFVSANGGLPGLPGVEIKPGPPIEEGEPFLHRDGDGHHSVEWPFEIPADCADGCQLDFPIRITQLGDGPLASFSFSTSVSIRWEDWQAKEKALGIDVPLPARASLEVIGPHEDQ